MPLKLLYQEEAIFIWLRHDTVGSGQGVSESDISVFESGTMACQLIPYLLFAFKQHQHLTMHPKHQTFLTLNHCVHAIGYNLQLIPANTECIVFFLLSITVQNWHDIKVNFRQFGSTSKDHLQFKSFLFLAKIHLIFNPTCLDAQLWSCYYHNRPRLFSLLYLLDDKQELLWIADEVE